MIKTAAGGCSGRNESSPCLSVTARLWLGYTLLISIAETVDVQHTFVGAAVIAVDVDVIDFRQRVGGENDHGRGDIVVHARVITLDGDYIIAVVRRVERDGQRAGGGVVHRYRVIDHNAGLWLGNLREVNHLTGTVTVQIIAGSNADGYQRE